MITPLSTGSGLERFVNCRASTVLERNFDERDTEEKTRGKEVHAFLKHVGNGLSAELALGMVDERFHAACRAVDLDSLRDVLSLTGELALAYNPVTDTARVLGVDIDREYAAAGLGESEIPMSVDVAGVDDPAAPSVGVVVDFKTGFSKRTPAARNWQLRGGALALGRAFDLDLVRVQLIHLYEDRPAYRDVAQFDSADLAMFAAEVRVRHELALTDRENYLMHGVRPDATQGSWCNYCPSYSVCSAKVGLVRSALQIDPGTIEDSIGRMSDVELVTTYKKLEAMIEPLKRARAAIKGIAAQRPLLLEEAPNGDRVFLGLHETVGNLKIDGSKAREVVRELLDEAAVDEVSKYTVTQALIEEAVKKRVPKGQGATKHRAIVEELKRRGAAVKPVKHDVTIYRVPANAHLKAV